MCIRDRSTPPEVYKTKVQSKRESDGNQHFLRGSSNSLLPERVVQPEADPDEGDSQEVADYAGLAALQALLGHRDHRTRARGRDRRVHLREAQVRFGLHRVEKQERPRRQHRHKARAGFQLSHRWRRCQASMSKLARDQRHCAPLSAAGVHAGERRAGQVHGG